MRQIPHPDQYIAGLYKPNTHAPDCDYYMFWEDLEQLGIIFKDESRREIRVPFEIDQKLVETAGAFTFTTDPCGQPVLCTERAITLAGIRTLLVIDESEPHGTNKILWLKQNCSPQSELKSVGYRVFGARLSDDDLILFKTRWEGAANR